MSDQPIQPSRFSVVSELRPVGAGLFDAVVSPEWTIAGKPNGGYLLAMLGRAAVATGTHKHVIAASAHYLRPPDPGPVTIEAESLRSGRNASQLRTRLSQKGQPCVEALFTTGELGAGSSPYWDGGVPVANTVDHADCLRVPGQSASGSRVAIMDQVDLRIEPSTAGFMTTGKPSGGGEIRGWLSLPRDEAFDPISLLYAVDAFPPATFEIEMTGWVPTLQLNVYVRALPAAGPVRVLHRAQLIDAQKVDEDCFVWDSAGRLVAHGTQLAAIRLG